jgi:hypothetical protein
MDNELSNETELGHHKTYEDEEDVDEVDEEDVDEVDEDESSYSNPVAY